jgi:hypothetical protein
MVHAKSSTCKNNAVKQMHAMLHLDMFQAKTLTLPMPANKTVSTSGPRCSHAAPSRILVSEPPNMHPRCFSLSARVSSSKARRCHGYVIIILITIQLNRWRLHLTSGACTGTEIGTDFRRRPLRVRTRNFKWHHADKAVDVGLPRAAGSGCSVPPAAAAASALTQSSSA